MGRRSNNDSPSKNQSKKHLQDHHLLPAEINGKEALKKKPPVTYGSFTVLNF